MKTFFKILAAIVIVLLVLWLAFDLIAPSIIKNKIENGLAQHPGDSVEISSLNIHYFPLGISIENTYAEIHQPSDSLLVQWQMKLHHAKAGGVKWWKAWQDDVWDLNTLEFYDGEIKKEFIVSDTLIRNKDSGSSGNMEFLLRNISIRDVRLMINQKASFIYFAASAEMDSLSIKKEDSLEWNVKRLTLQSDSALLREVMTDHDIAYQQLHYDSGERLLNIADFSISPRISREEFAKRYPKRKIQPIIKVPSMYLSGIQLDKINRGLYAHKLLLDSADVKIYQDLNKERPDKFKPLPSEIIADIPFPVEMDSLRIKNSILTYEHQGIPQNLGLAVLEGDEIDLSFYPISNIGHENCADVKIKGSLRFYKEAVLSLNVTCFADKPNHDYELNTHLTPVAFAVFNPILYPSGGIKFESGFCEGIEAFMHGNDYSTQGNVDFIYKDLKIEIPADGTLTGILAELGEVVGNTALVNENNSKDSDNGKIDYKRNVNQPFVNYWWKSLQNGLMDAAITVK